MRPAGWAAVMLLAAGACRPAENPPAVRVFHAAGLSPFLRQICDDCDRDLGVNLQLEASGSQEACRKLTELGRPCDVVMLADRQLVTELLGGVCRWRIDFATDELVLGVGARAVSVEAAERNWAEVVLQEPVRLARVDENLGPIGYRTLLALKLQEQITAVGLHDAFVARCQKIVDDVERLPALLRSGEIDYAVIYRSTCIAHGIRYIELDDRVNLGSPDIDYSRAEVRFAKRKSGARETVVVRGAPIVWTLTQPEKTENREAAVAFVGYCLREKSGELDAAGFRPLKRPRFFGPAPRFERFQNLAEYGGELR